MGFPFVSLKGLILGLSPVYGAAGCSICTPIFILSWICFVWSMVWENSYNGGSKKGYKLELLGAGDSRSVRALHDMVRRWNPKVMFLIETKAKTRRMEGIKNRIGLTNGLIVPCVGRKGGLALLWTREIDLEIKCYSLNHIDAVINDAEKSIKWRLTGFYGHPETHRRYES